MRVLYDSNVIIDAFSARPERNKFAIDLVQMALKGEVEGCLSAKQVTDIYYALRRYASQKVRDRIMRLLLDWFYILPLQPEYLSKALRYSEDYEDEVLIVTAEENRISYIVTGDKTGFVSYPSAITPEEAITVLKKTN